MVYVGFRTCLEDTYAVLAQPGHVTYLLGPELVGAGLDLDEADQPSGPPAEAVRAPGAALPRHAPEGASRGLHGLPEMLLQLG